MSLEDSTYDFLSDAGRSDSSAQTESIAALSELDETSSTGYAFDSDLEDTEDEGDVIRRRRVHTPERNEEVVEIVELMNVDTDGEDGGVTDDEDARMLNSDLNGLTGRTLVLEDFEEHRKERILDLVHDVFVSRRGEMLRLAFFFLILLASTIATSNMIEATNAWWQAQKGQTPTKIFYTTLQDRNPAMVQVPKQAGTMEAIPGSENVGLGQLLASLDLISQQSKSILSNMKAASSSSSSSSSSTSTSTVQQPSPILNAPNVLSKWAKPALALKKHEHGAHKDKVQIGVCQECEKRRKQQEQKEKPKEKPKKGKTPAPEHPVKKEEQPRLSLPFPPPRLTLDASLAFARAQDRAVLMVEQVAAVAARAEQVAEHAWDSAVDLIRDKQQHQKIVDDSLQLWQGFEKKAIEGAGEAVRMTAWATGRFRAKWEEVSEFLGNKAEEMELEKRVDEAIVLVGKVGDHMKGATCKKLHKAQKRARKLRKRLFDKL